MTATRLSEWPKNQTAVITAVTPHDDHDAVAHRLHDIGFVVGEAVKILAFSPFGRDPMVVQVGFTRFALRRAEAARIQVTALQGMA